jgi:hypothetical protein
MQKSYSGQEAIEFVLIGVLVFAAGIFSFLMLGDKLGAFFEKDSAVAKIAGQKASAIDVTTPSKYDPSYVTEVSISDNPLYSLNLPEDEETSEDVITSCTTEDCVITFGKFTLSNITPDMSKVIKASGASGGTEYMVKHLAEIAQQLEEQGLLTESSQVQLLANLGHNLAAIEKEAEKAINSCIVSSDNQSCVNNLWDTEIGSIDGFNYSIQPNNMKTLGDYIWGTSLGYPAALKQSGSSTYDELKAQGQTNVKMYEIMEQIKANPNLDETAKSVIQELYWHIGAVGEDFENNIRFLKGESSGVHDPLIGGSKGTAMPDDPVDFFKNYSGSKVTHYDSAIICATGKYSDTGTSCHKSLIE